MGGGVSIRKTAKKKTSILKSTLCCSVSVHVLPYMHLKLPWGAASERLQARGRYVGWAERKVWVRLWFMLNQTWWSIGTD